MKTRRPLGLKLFVGMGVPFGLVTEMFMATDIGIIPGMAAGLAGGLLFGAGMAVFTGLTQVLGSSRFGKQKAVLGVEQRRTFKVLGSREQALNSVRIAFGQIGVRQVDGRDEDAGILRARTPVSWHSWGERLMAVVKEQDGACEITVLSEPKMSLTLVDGGRNHQNVVAVEELVQQIHQTLGSPEPGLLSSERQTLSRSATRALAH